MRVGGPHYYPLRPDSPIGGEVYERELLRRLPDHGVDLTLGLPRDHAPPADPRWHVDTLRHGRIHWTRAPLVFAPYARKLDVDVLRGHSVRHTGPALLAARRGRPVVLHHHHLFPRWARLEAAIAARADAVVAVSRHAADELAALGVRGNVHVIPEGIATPPPTDGWPDAWPAGSPRLLQLGRLEDRKRPDLAIETLRRLPGASLVLAGDGDQTALRERAAGLPVAFLGHVGEHDKWRLYDSADVLLFGSTLEGFGLVVAEAQSRGVPVVAASGTATAEAMDDGRTGFLVAPDPDAFAGAVARLTPEMRDAARAFARRFDWDACAARVAELYRSLA